MDAAPDFEIEATLPRLDKDAHQTYSQWWRILRLICSGVLTEYYYYGALHLILSAAEFAALPHPTIEGELNTDIIAEVVEPQLPAVGATQWDFKFFDLAKTKYDRITKAKIFIKKIIIGSMSTEIRQVFINPRTSTVVKGIRPLIIDIQANYGILSTFDITKLRHKLLAKFTSNTPAEFMSWAANLTDLMQQLEDVNQPLSDYDVMMNVDYAISENDVVKKCKAQYLIAFPLVSTRSFGAMIIFIHDQLSSGVYDERPFAGSAFIMSAMAMTVAASDMSANAAAAVAPPVRAPAAVPANAAAAPRRQPRFRYCYKHGSTSYHAGSRCNHMLANQGVGAGKFTPAMIAATDASTGGAA